MNKSRSRSKNMDFIYHRSTVLHQVILPSILDAKAKAKKILPGVSLPEVLQDCLKTAGISYHGQDALELHFHAFSNCFAPISKCILNNEGKIAEKECFSFKDYFLCVIDDKLQWFSFYLELLPYLRIETVIEVISRVVDFVHEQTEGRHLTAAELCLTASSLEMIFIVFIDLLAHGGEIAGDSAGAEGGDQNVEEFNNSVERLSQLAAACLAQVTEALKMEGTVVILKKEPFAFQYLGDMLFLAVIFLNPFDSEEDIIKFISANKRETVWPANDHNKSSHGFQMKEIRRSRFADVKEEQNHIVCKDSEVNVIGDDPNLKKDAEQSNQGRVQNKEEVKENHAGCSRIIMDHLRCSIKPKIFVDILSFLTSHDPENSECVYECLTSVACGQIFIKIGHYVIARECLFSYLKRKILYRILEIVQNGDMAMLPLYGELESSLKDLRCWNGGNQTELTSHETHNCAERLEVVKKAVMNREKGWQELLCQGMEQTDVEAWWNAGFYDLVWENIELLSNEKNTACVVKVLFQISQKDPIDEKAVTSMTKLFSAMYDRLPLLLQESLVVSCSKNDNWRRDFMSSNCVGVNHESLSLDKNSESESEDENVNRNFSLVINDVLAVLKSEEDVIKELIPLLNKLTVNSAREIAPTVLKLCLYQSDAVLGHMLQAAMRNSGQVLPVIELLRQIPKVCTNPCLGMGQSRICHCFRELLYQTSLDEKETENVISLITHLIQEFVQVVDPNRKLTKSQAGLFRVEEILAHLILPSLNEGLNNNRSESKDSDVVLPASVSLSCLASMVKSVSVHSFGGLKFLLLIKIVVEVIGCNFTVDYVDIKKHRNLIIKERAFACHDAMLTRAIENLGSFSEEALRCLRDQVCQSSLLSMTLCYPLLSATRDFQMFPYLLAIMEKDIDQDAKSVFQAVTRLLQLGLVNKASCTDVCDVFHRMKQTIDKKQLTAIIAHVLSQSLASQMAQLPGLVLALIGKTDDVSHSMGPRGELVAKATDHHFQYAEMVSDALLLLSGRNVPDAFLRHFVSNFQAAIQGLLSGMNQEHATPDLHYFLCHQCCFLLCRLSGEASTQGLRVLAIATLDRWSHQLPLPKGSQATGTSEAESKKQSGVKVATGTGRRKRQGIKETKDSFKTATDDKTISLASSTKGDISNDVGDKIPTESDRSRGDDKGASQEENILFAGESKVDSDGGAEDRVMNQSRRDGSKEDGSTAPPDGNNLLDDETKDCSGDEVEDKARGSTGATEWKLEDFQRLRDVMVCIRDEEVKGQLLKQLDNVRNAFSS